MMRRQRRSRQLSAFLYGVAHALDFSGAFARNRGRFGQGFQGDAAALRSDWMHALERARNLAPRQREHDAA